MSKIEYQTDLYYILVEKNKNLILIRPIGFWDSAADVSDYLPTIRHALDHELEDHFSVICDLHEMKSASKEIRDGIHAQAGLEVLKRNVRVTVFVSPESAITRMQIEHLRKIHVQKPIKQVATLQEAYDFIDAYQPK